jgi:hypothetical protein
MIRLHETIERMKRGGIADRPKWPPLHGSDRVGLASEAALHELGALPMLSTNEYEDDYESASDRPFSLASGPFQASIKDTEAYDRKSIVRTDRT